MTNDVIIRYRTRWIPPFEYFQCVLSFDWILMYTSCHFKWTVLTLLRSYFQKRSKISRYDCKSRNSVSDKDEFAERIEVILSAEEAPDSGELRRLDRRLIWTLLRVGTGRRLRQRRELLDYCEQVATGSGTQGGRGGVHSICGELTVKLMQTGTEKSENDLENIRLCYH